MLILIEFAFFSRCLCPDGFVGDRCEKIISDTKCDQSFRLRFGESTLIKSPGYETLRYYDNFEECTWLFTTNKRHKIFLRFQGRFCKIITILKHDKI